jgi:hypothetical protein
MNPLLAACQMVNVAQPGSEPPLDQAQEDMRLFSTALADKNGGWRCKLGVDLLNGPLLLDKTAATARYLGNSCMTQGDSLATLVAFTRQPGAECH